MRKSEVVVERTLLRKVETGKIIGTVDEKKRKRFCAEVRSQDRTLKPRRDVKE